MNYDKRTKCRAQKYAEHVLSGKIIAGRLVKLACQRHLSDLKNGHKRGLYYDREEAEKALKFFGYLTHTKGEWAGKPFVPELWQAFEICSVFGWKRADGTRRFRRWYDEVARKNGKSTKAAGVANKCLVGDKEPGADVYTAATKRDQAKIVFEEAKRQVMYSPPLKRLVNILKNNLNVPSTNSKMEPLSADAKTLDGLNTHCGVADEVHAHPNRMVVDLLDTSTGARRQPLIFYITTAGFDRYSVCWSLREYSIKVLEGIIEDDSWFAYIATIDDDDDWEDESVWIKANPNLGVSVKIDDLREKAVRAKSSPSYLNSFLRLHLNVWTDAETSWLDAGSWNGCEIVFHEDDVAGRDCYGGLDLSTTRDITALGWVFPPQKEGEKVKILGRWFVPEDTIHERSRQTGVPYDVWARQGHLLSTPGNVVDYDFIEKQILDDCKKFKVKALAYDRYNSSQLVNNLMAEGIPMMDYGQGFVSMSAPSKEFEKLVISKELQHSGDPVLAWAVSNVVVKEDPAGNIKPAKDKSTEKIDPVVAIIMALGLMINNSGDDTSVYEERGILVL